MTKLESIISGWKNLLYRDPSVEVIAIERAKKCASCNNLGALGFCSICSCYVPAKVRSLNEKCPINEW